MAKGTFDEPRCSAEKSLEVRSFYYLLNFRFRELFGFCLLLFRLLFVISLLFKVHASLACGSSRLSLSYEGLLQSIIEVIVEVIKLVVFCYAAQPAGSWVWDITHDFLVIRFRLLDPWNLDFDNEC